MMSASAILSFLLLLAPGRPDLPEKCVNKQEVIETPTKFIKHGQKWECHDNGGWKRAVTFKNGEKEGFWTWWYENGKKGS
ncbi:MAG: hypothetical protein ACPHRO_07140, partial [Nannocystaceae bacterium]